MKRLIEKVQKFIVKHELIVKGDHILVALSGGPDSVAMLHIINQFKRKFNLKISAAHLNHSLRGKDSDEDEKFVKRLCKSLQIELFTLKVNVKSFSKVRKIGIEETSRELRYEYLNKISKEIKANKIATAHTADDNLETVLLNIVRGTGLKGISGIPIKRSKIIRPMLCLSKDEVLEFLHETNAKFRIDKTNQKNIFRRNLIRNKVVGILKKMNPSLPETVLRFSHLISQYEKYFDSQAKQFQRFIVYSGSSIVLDISEQIDYFEIIIMHLLSQNIEEKFGIQPTMADLEKVVSLKDMNKGALVEISGGLFALRESEKIIIQKSNSKEFNGCSVRVGKNINGDYFSFTSKQTKLKKFSESRSIELIDKNKINEELFLRPWKNGDKLTPLGMKNSKKISDILTDFKIPHLNRKRILVLCHGEEIVWICGVRLSEKYKISRSSEEFLQLKIRYEFELQ